MWVGQVQKTFHMQVALNGYPFITISNPSSFTSLLDPVKGHPAGRPDDLVRQEQRVPAHVAIRSHETTVCFVPKYSWTAICATPNNGLPAARIYQVSETTTYHRSGRSLLFRSTPCWSLPRGSKVRVVGMSSSVEFRGGLNCRQDKFDLLQCAWSFPVSE